MISSPRMPLTAADPHRGVLPSEYVFRIRKQMCRQCRAEYQVCDLMAKAYLRSSGTSFKTIENFRAMGRTGPELNLPISRVEFPPEVLAFCSECFTEDQLIDLPVPPLPETEARVIGLRNENSDPKRERVSTEPSKVHSLDELGDLLR